MKLSYDSVISGVAAQDVQPLKGIKTLLLSSIFGSERGLMSMRIVQTEGSPFLPIESAWHESRNWFLAVCNTVRFGGGGGAL